MRRDNFWLTRCCGPAGCGNYSPNDISFVFNVNSSQTVPQIAPGAKRYCAGPVCAAWRWSKLHTSPEEIADNPADEGRCGLAGPLIPPVVR